MNNEPVAWMMVNRENTSAYLTFEKPTRDMKISHEPTPLYTHPVKEQDESFDRTASHMAGEYVSHPEKELTDEEIKDVYFNTFNWNFSESVSSPFLDFARAILRKAQEK